MSKVRPVVVIVEDDAKLRRLLRGSLQEAGFDVREADGGRAGLEVAAARKPDLIILDLGLPDLDGLEVLRTLRQWWRARPLIVLSGREEQEQKVAALEQGADDYVTKPFSSSELLARVRAALRRASRHADPDPSAAFRCRGVSVDLLRREVTRNGQPVELTPNEFRVLALLVKNAGLLVATQTLIRELWGPGAQPNRRQYLRGYLSSLRQKLEENPARPALLLTEAGVGYRLALGETDGADPAGHEAQDGVQESAPPP
jgi:two-component system KDP operon response regulator KdpE